MSFTIATISSTVVTSITVLGEEVMPPNQFFTGDVVIWGLSFLGGSSLGLLGVDRFGRHDGGPEHGLHQLGEESGHAYAEALGPGATRISARFLRIASTQASPTCWGVTSA